MAFPASPWLHECAGGKDTFLQSLSKASLALTGVSPPVKTWTGRQSSKGRSSLHDGQYILPQEVQMPYPRVC